MPASDGCYRLTPGGIFLAADNSRCPGPAADDGNWFCCHEDDVCLSNGICHYTHALEGGSGYYVGTCSDKTYKSSTCSQQCLDQYRPDVVFNTKTDLWACCGYDESKSNIPPTCSTPTKQTFQAPAPEVLLAQQSAATKSTSTVSSTSARSTSRSTSTSSTSVATTTSTGNNPTTAPITNGASSSSSGLSTGAAAGIGVGCALAGVLIIGLLVWAFLGHRKRSKQVAQTGHHGQHAASSPRELGNNQAVRQLAPQQVLQHEKKGFFAPQNDQRHHQFSQRAELGHDTGGYASGAAELQGHEPASELPSRGYNAYGR